MESPPQNSSDQNGRPGEEHSTRLGGHKAATLTFDEAKIDSSKPEQEQLGLLDLSKQLQNVLLMKPLFKLDLDKNRYRDEQGASSGLEKLDTNFLVLALFDFLMEGVALGGGRTSSEVVMHLVEAILAMDPTLDSLRAESCAEKIFDAVLNRAGTYRDFEYEFFHGPSGAFRKFRFSLIRFTQEASGQYLYKPTEEGYLVYLGMLDLSPDISSELMEKMLDLLVSRGKYREAIDIARRARTLSIEYRQTIGDAVSRVKRAPASIKWSRDMTPRLTEARVHVEKRRKEDERMIESVDESITRSREATIKQDLFVLKGLLSSSSNIRTRLLNELATAPEEFLRAQKFLFRPRGNIGLPNLDDVLLPAVLKLPVWYLARESDKITTGFQKPVFPGVFDFNSILYSILSRRTRPALPLIEDGEIIPAKPEPPQYPVEMIEFVQNWASALLHREDKITIEQILTKAHAELHSDIEIKCLVHMLFRSFAPSESVFYQSRVNLTGRRFRTSLVQGTSLQFENAVTHLSKAQLTEPISDGQ